MIPDQPSGSAYVKSEYYHGNTVDHLSVNEKSAIKGVLDSIENARSQHEEDQPAELTIVLLRHQRQGLSWMVKQEQGVHKGGILADEMGLGKTVQSIAVILKNKPTDHRKSTLIVAPLAVMQQVCYSLFTFQFIIIISIIMVLTSVLFLFSNSGTPRLSKRPRRERLNA